eukprot:m.20913 g.20913  ORF g.20913 m.20913 type:complete len:80 (-) comp8640_c0_seq1:439-678(-)
MRNTHAVCASFYFPLVGYQNKRQTHIDSNSQNKHQSNLNTSVWSITIQPSMALTIAVYTSTPISASTRSAASLELTREE